MTLYQIDCVTCKWSHIRIRDTAHLFINLYRIRSEYRVLCKILADVHQVQLGLSSKSTQCSLHVRYGVQSSLCCTHVRYSIYLPTISSGTAYKLWACHCNVPLQCASVNRVLRSSPWLKALYSRMQTMPFALWWRRSLAVCGVSGLPPAFTLSHKQKQKLSKITHMIIGY